MQLTTRKTLTAVSIAAIAMFGLSACSMGASGSGGSSGAAASTQPSAMPSETPSMTADPAADLVGPGCAAYAAAVPDGSGSIAGMSADPVAVAASHNPMLKTLAAAVSGQLNPDVNLVDTLNGSKFTVFAPVDAAFAKLDPATVEALKTPAGAATLSKVLTYHVVPGQIAPDAIAGMQTTVEGGTVNVTGSGDSIKVNDANVICGGVHTANATVYLIDSVLMPTN
jgi:uncharacterized surface protein with fasciclin (FAS1) repeats